MFFKRLPAGPVRLGPVLTALLAVGLCQSGARAQSGPDSYSGKTITIVTQTTAGAIYDTYARLLARFLPDHLAGHPAVIVQDMPGAGGLTAMRYLSQAAPRDGTVIGTSTRTLIFEPLLGNNVAGVDYMKFGWLGSMSRSTAVYVSWHTSKVETAADLFDHDLLIAGTGAAAETTVTSNAINNILDTRIRLVQGYPGSVEGLLAMERGEVDGGFPTLGALKTEHPDWLREGKVNLLFQTTPVADPEIGQVPTVLSLARDDEQRRVLGFLFPRDVIGRPFATPPGLGPRAVALLQDAFEATVNDPRLRDEAARMQLPIDLATGGDLSEVIRQAYATSPDIVDKARKAVGSD